MTTSQSRGFFIVPYANVVECPMIVRSSAAPALERERPVLSDRSPQNVAGSSRIESLYKTAHRKRDLIFRDQGLKLKIETVVAWSTYIEPSEFQFFPPAIHVYFSLISLTCSCFAPCLILFAPIPFNYFYKFSIKIGYFVDQSEASILINVKYSILIG